MTVYKLYKMTDQHENINSSISSSNKLQCQCQLLNDKYKLVKTKLAVENQFFLKTAASEKAALAKKYNTEKEGAVKKQRMSKSRKCTPEIVRKQYRAHLICVCVCLAKEA